MTDISFNNIKYAIKVWEPNSPNNIIGSQFISFDTETTITPAFYLTPDLVTVQAYAGGNTVYYIRRKDLSNFLSLHNNNCRFIFHNASFDMDVLIKEDGNLREYWYSKLDRDHVFDTSIMYRLLHLAKEGYIPFKYNLNLLSKEFLGEGLIKDDDVRMTFEQYLHTPVEEIPEAHLQYGALDAIATYFLFFKLRGEMAKEGADEKQFSQHIQVKGDFALNHVYKNGIQFDLRKRDEWLRTKDYELGRIKDILRTYGYVPGFKHNYKGYKRVIEQLGITLPKTGKSNKLSMKKEDLLPYVEECPFIKYFLDYNDLLKDTSFVREQDNERIHPRYNLLVNTGRTSCAKPNFQQLPRDGAVRSMYCAKPDHTLIITDYSAIELCTLSQELIDRYGSSVMGDKINEGSDLHRYYASVMYKCNPEDVNKRQRQEAKAANFGFPGGLGVDTFISFSSGYGLDLSPEQAREMKNTWFEAFPEIRDYMQGEQGYVFTRTGRKRGNTTYCAEKNTPFQGLAADGAKLALYNLDKAGFKIVGFVHDEIICEVDSKSHQERVSEIETIMIESMQQVVPDVRISVESVVSDVYCK